MIGNNGINELLNLLARSIYKRRPSVSGSP